MRAISRGDDRRQCRKAVIDNKIIRIIGRVTTDQDTTNYLHPALTPMLNVNDHNPQYSSQLLEQRCKYQLTAIYGRFRQTKSLGKEQSFDGY